MIEWSWKKVTALRQAHSLAVNTGYVRTLQSFTNEFFCIAVMQGWPNSSKRVSKLTSIGQKSWL